MHKRNKKGQNGAKKAILEHLIKHGTIDRRQSAIEFGHYGLPETISRLKKQGWHIETIDNGIGKICTYKLHLVNK